MKTTTRIGIVVLLMSACFSVLASTSEGDSPDSSAKLALIQRYLRATGYTKSLRHGIEAAVQGQGSSTPFLDGILAASDETIVIAAAPLYVDALSADEALALVGFYESPAGRRIVRQQLDHLDDPDPPISLTHEQRAEYDAFAAGLGGQAVAKVISLQHSEAYQAAFKAAMTRMLE